MVSLRPTIRGTISALLAALCFATVPALVLSAHSGGATVLTLLAVRYWLTSFVLVPVSVAANRGRLPPLRQLLRIMLISGIFLGLQAALYFFALTRLPSSIAVLVLFTFPLIITIHDWLTGKPASKDSILVLMLCLAGLAILLGPDFSRLDIVGLGAALLAAIAYSVYMILIDRSSTGMSPAVINAAVSLANAITMTLAAVATGTFQPDFNFRAWLSIILIVAVTNIAGMQLFFIALKQLGPQRTAVLNMAEPLFAVLIGLAVLHEQLKAVQLTGAVVLMIGLTLFTWLSNHGEQMKSPEAREVEHD
ncbi:MAG: EamA family transporter [Bacillota bacterium]|nr:EamA family transporter [Bacillota bacterium]